MANYSVGVLKQRHLHVIYLMSVLLYQTDADAYYVWQVIFLTNMTLTDFN